MNLIQLSNSIYKCEFSITVPFHNSIIKNDAVSVPVNVWLIKHDENVYIIDTGIEKLVDEQMKAAAILGTPKAIFLTHGHSDHIQGAAKWLEHFDISVYAHEKELKYINGEVPYPNKNILEKNGVANRVKPLNQQLFDQLPISYHLTPGHSPGHVVYHHEEDNVLLSGDLFITAKDKLHPPIRKFSVNMDENIDSGAIVEKLKPAVISSSHGTDLRYQEELYKNYVFTYRD
ncbi:MBL fold metallo-hydrolase [Falsibacillus albus]|uniref:MBL fold metallo-hydrolase n=1 Tax=Falsibacillus albus TaxID=2478915 RepID=A0A3L7JNP7_9BACI|nr:MBL fold metallo-hydrolase [Falsibacillus albus]RLQ92403.1 MBL fold metallo-hydrolase [Falsibacillus albus]